MLLRGAILTTCTLGGVIACTRVVPAPIAAASPSVRSAELPAESPGEPPTARAVAPAASPGFYPVVTYEEWLGLFPLGGDTLMIAAGPKLVRVDGRGVLHDDPGLTAGITLPWPGFTDAEAEDQSTWLSDAGGWWTVQIGGTWPSAAFLTLSTPMMPRAPDVYRWAGDRWRPARVATTHYVAYPRAIRAWKDGSVLAWRGFYARALDLDDQCSQCPDEMFETPKYRAAQRAVATAKPLAVIAGPAKAPALAGRELVAFDASPSGEIFGALVDGSLLVLRDGGAPRTIAAIGAPEVSGIVARGPTDVVTFGATASAPYLARFDGAKAVTIATPECGAPIVSLSIHDQTWWATCGEPIPRSYDDLAAPGDAPSSLWRREGDGAWTQVVLAPDLQPRLVHARGPEDVWLSAITRDHAVVLHSREPSRVLALDSTIALIQREFGRR